jgi:hypothetical protein
MSRKPRMYGKSGMREIMAGRYVPINNQARHGLTDSQPSRLPLPDEPIPKDGINCSKWTQDTIEQFFRKRYPMLGFESLNRLTRAAMRDGRIEGMPAFLGLLKSGRLPKQMRMPAQRKPLQTLNPATVRVWNPATEAEVRAIVASGASVPASLMKITPKGFVAGLRAARRQQNSRPPGK